jgi:hypothetical protein
VSRRPGCGRVLVVTTQSATYVLDTGDGWVVRGRADAPVTVDHDVAALRRDGEPMRLVGVEHLEVGRPMRLILTGLHPVAGVLTVRETTPVLAIEEAPP